MPALGQGRGAAATNGWNSSATACSAWSSPTCSAPFPERRRRSGAPLRAPWCSARRLAEVAEAIGLGASTMRLGEAEAQAARARPTILADACEAVIAALYLDGGFAAARALLERLLGRAVERDARRPPHDAKTALQEWAQARGLPLPVYRAVGREGPAHAPPFSRGRGQGYEPGRRPRRHQARRRAAGGGGAARAAETDA